MDLHAVEGVRRPARAEEIAAWEAGFAWLTGEIRILQSVQAFDTGTILNPMQARGQIEGGIAQGIGATLFERMVVDASG
jgi:CO/xanthine dehydrogenase Mo-binding subunit